MTRLLLQHVRSCAGDEGLQRVLTASGEDRDVAVLFEDRSWSSYDQFRRLLESTGELLGSAKAIQDIGRTAALEAGSMPGATEAFLAIGSVNAMLAELNHGNSGVSTIEHGGYTEQVGATEWILGRHLDEGYEPFPELCAFHVGNASMVPRLFGFDDVTCEEISCQRQGDRFCRMRLRWTETDPHRHRADFLATRLAVAERRMEEFQATIADLVSADRLDPLLERLVTAAAGAVRAPAYVLALEPLPWPAPLVYAVGMPHADAVELAARIATGDPCPDDLVVDVQSSHRKHGKLIAVGAAGMLPPSSQALFESYAGLTASALDSAIAIEDARRQAQTATLLLELAQRLARVDSLPAMAHTLAELVPGVLGCDRAVVALIDGDRLQAQPLAVSGYSPEMEALMLASTIELPGPIEDVVTYYDRSIETEAHRELMEATGSIACVMVPIVVDDEVVGWIAGDAVENPDALRPSRQLEERLQGLSAQASTAMHNALLLDRVRHQADHDALTGLANRAVLVSSLGATLERGAAAGMLFVDLDDFKDVNDGLGHLAGDELLRAVSRRLTAVVGDDDVVARLGGDEFAVLLVDPAPGATLEVARQLVAALDEPFELRGDHVSVSASVGVSSGHGIDGDELLRNADIAMYRAKAAGKGRLAIFEPGMDHAAAERLSLHAELDGAVAGDQLRLVYQPVFDLRTGLLRGCEALVRWQHPELGLLPPDRFIELAESTGLIVDLGRWVLDTACAQAARWPDDVAIAVNVSPRQLDEESILEDVRTALEAHDLRPDRLILEITENAMAEDVDRMRERLEAIRALGVRIAVDDFGTGYSTLSSLMLLPVDVLKIDRSFVASMLDHPGGVALVQALIDIGRSLGLDVIAEGIEEPEQARLLSLGSCEQGQGFLYSRPVPPEELDVFLADPDRQPMVALP